MRVLNTVDLFCGAGGASTGMEDALHDLKLTHKGLAINHWAVAVDMSHPGDPNDERRVSGGDEPMRTVTTRNNNALVTLPVLPDGRVIDIRLRMLKPSELAAAHSFPKDYILTGNRSEQVKQIGNSVPVRTAAAMCAADFKEAS